MSLQSIELRLSETESDNNEEIATQRRMYSSLDEPVSQEVTQAIERYQTLIGQLTVNNDLPRLRC